MPAVQDTIDRVRKIDVDQYKYGFETEIAVDKAPKGLSEDIIRFISAKKDEPSWMLEWRLEAYRRWLTLEEPTWARVHYPKIDFQDIYFYAAPKSTPGPSSLSDVDPELLKVYEKLGIPLREQEILAGVQKTDASDLEEPSDNVYKSGRVAVDAVFDSVSVVTTFKKELAQAGVIFCSISEAIREHPELVKKYLGSVVPTSDNYYATLNSAVFTDGSFVYVPKGVRCPMELSTYFRMSVPTMPHWRASSRRCSGTIGCRVRRSRQSLPILPVCRPVLRSWSPKPTGSSVSPSARRSIRDPACAPDSS